MKQSEQYRFWSKVRIGWPNDCWLWQAATDGKGYGAFKVNGRIVGAHRYALLAAHGRLDDPSHVLHSCDVPACCNVRHLRLGTRAENMADMVERGRQAKGAGHGGAKLTDGAVREIRRLCAAGVKQTEIAAAFGVTNYTVSDIKLSRRWGWLK